MNQRTLSIQRLDPLLTRAIWPVALVALAASVGLAVVGSVSTINAGGSVLLNSLALALVLAGTTLFVVLIWPGAAPVSSLRHGILYGLYGAATSITLVAESLVERAEPLGWSPLVLGTLLLILSPFVLWQELLVSTVVSAGYLAVLTYALFSGNPSERGHNGYVLVLVFPVVALGVAGVVFARALETILRLWREQAREAARTEVTYFRAGIGRSVQQEQVTILGTEVMPMLSALLEAGTIREQDRQLAATLADRIRSTLVARSEHSWLDALVVEIARVETDALAEHVRADDNSAAAVPAEARPRVRAVLSAIVAHPAYRRDSLRVSVTSSGHLAGTRQVVFMIEADIVASEQQVRSALSPYLAVLRASFHGYFVTIESGHLLMSFGCDSDG